MRFNIYDFNGCATEVDTGDKVIKDIFVQVISGDEVVTVYYDDCTRARFDSSRNRTPDYAYSSYILHPNNLQDWVNFEITDYDKQPGHVHYKNGTHTIPIKRLFAFMEDDD
jgi:hypothetical protein|nr:MAG TPA: hypothetical protein [Caudoviricetes sp.]